MTARFWRLWSIAPAALLLALSAAPGAQGEPTGAGDTEARAMESVRRMSAFLAESKRFGVTIDVGYDIVQDWGQKIEFGETRRLTVRRPDRLRLDTTSRDGSASGVVFDGNEVTAFDMAHEVYATEERAGTIEEMIAYFVHDLGMRLPLSSFLSSRLPQIVQDFADDIAYVERSAIAGVVCDHVALRGDWEDVQMWIAQGDRPLLQRLVITYTRAEGKPQFWAQFRDWNLSPAAADSVFSFKPGEGMGRIPFAAQAARLQPGGAGPQGGQP